MVKITKRIYTVKYLHFHLFLLSAGSLSYSSTVTIYVPFFFFFPVFSILPSTSSVLPDIFRSGIFPRSVLPGIDRSKLKACILIGAGKLYPGKEPFRNFLLQYIPGTKENNKLFLPPESWESCWKNLSICLMMPIQSFTSTARCPESSIIL